MTPFVLAPSTIYSKDKYQMAQLPYDEKLKIGYLSRLFDNTSNCYKFFWFQAILNKLSEDKTRFTYDELINEMIADAWYMVIEYHLRLGPCGVTDNLEEAVKYIGKVKQFPASEKRSVIISYLENSNDNVLLGYKKELIKNVPYRIQSPFLNEIQIDKREWGYPEVLTHKINQQRHLLYYYDAFGLLSTRIIINEDWVPYLLRNKEILKGWMQLNLIHYLQRRNPSVPGIADKLSTPQSRDIERVRKYWKLIISLKPQIRDIYGHIDLINEKISIDHFVPWQYVAHDELWNLHPTTKSINSSKSNGLPEWDTYFDPLCKMEFLSYSLIRENEKVADAFLNVAKYHINNEEVRRTLYCDGLAENDFADRLHNIIRPVYEAARNNGFREWKYEGALCQ